MSLQQLREERATKHREAMDIARSLREDDLSDGDRQEREAKFDAWSKWDDEAKAKIEREERLAKVDKEMGESTDPDSVLKRHNIPTETATKDDPRVDFQEVRGEAFRDFLKYGAAALNQEQRMALAGMQAQMGADEQRAAQAVGTDSAGGYTVPEGFAGYVEVALAEYGGARADATVIQTAGGGDLPFPTMNDTANSASIITENAQISETALTFGQTVLQSYMYGSLVLASIQFLNDEEVNAEQVIARALGERLARGTNAHFTTGTGTGQPNGFITAGALGKTAAANNAITASELMDLEGSVDPAYRRNGSFQLNDGTLTALKQLTVGASDDRPLWIPSIREGEPDRLLGYRYQVNQDIATIATTAKVVSFGDHSKYMIRDVAGATLMRLTERYADYLQVGFLMFSRHDGDLLDAGTNPVKYLQMAV